MRKLLFVFLVLMMAAPAWGYTLPTSYVINDVPELSVTAPTRPSIDGGRIVVGQYPAPAVNGKAAVYSIYPNVLREWGGAAFPNWTVQPAGYGQNNTVGIAGQWAALGGGPTANSNNSGQKVWFANLATNATIGYAGTSADEHFPDVNSLGDAVWVRWNNPGFSIMYGDLNNPGNPQIALPLTGVPTDSSCPNFADNARKFIYSNATQHRLYDLATNTDYLIFDKGASTMNILRARIADDGNWAVTNTRPEGEGSKRANIILYDLRTPATPVRFNLTGVDTAGGATVIREDPTIEMIDADTAVIAWGQCTAPEGSNIYDIRAAVVTGLVAGTPVMGTPVIVAQSTANLHFPEMDGNIITWVKDWAWLSGGGSTASVVQYTFIPEPASLSLLLLGATAMRRRR